MEQTPITYRLDKVVKDAGSIIFTGLGRTIFIWFLLISLIPVTVVSLVSYMNAHISLKADAEQSLTAAMQLKKEYLEAYFSERLNDLALQSENENNIQLLEQLRQAYLASGMPVRRFITSQACRDIYSAPQKGLRNFAAIYGYYDVLLLDVDGNILFSVMGENDLGTNIFTDEFAETRFAKASWETLETGLPMGADIEAYAPAKNALVLFFVQAMKDKNGEPIGLLAFKLPIHQINDIMQVKTGLGKTGQTYLVGQDMLMRSDAAMYKDSTMLKQKVDTEIVRSWLSAENFYYESTPKKQKVSQNISGPKDVNSANSLKNVGNVNTYAGPQGRLVLGSFSGLDSLEALGLHWAMIAEIDLDEAFGPAIILRNIVFGLATVTGILVVILALIVTRRIVLPVRNISDWAKRVSIGQLAYENIKTGKNEIGELNNSFNLVVDSFKSITDVCQSVAEGDFSKSVVIRSEYDILGRSVNQMADNLRSVVRQAKAVTDGNYSTVISPKSDKDELEIALFDMTSKLREMTENNDKEDWLKAGYNELNNAMRGEQDIHTLSNNIIAFLAGYLNSFVGALYVVQDDGNLHLTGGYAYRVRVSETNVFSIGEGLVGQAAQDKKMIMISEVPSNYVKIESGTGSTIPHGLLVKPFFFENRVTGVIELGAFYRFSDLQLDFLNGVIENIGISLNTAKSRSLMTKLLDETKEQAEKLRAQQQELWKTNEALEERTRALEDSEKHLQTQQEELRVANEELEERTQALEEQRDAIRNKNKELEKAQQEIQKKAKDLEQANNYKSEFLANMSHELRTPLNSILILSQLLTSRDITNLTDKQLEYARTIHSSGSDLLSLINEILDLAKVESGRMELHLEQVELSELLDNMEKLFKHVAVEKGIEFKVVSGNDLPLALRTDAQRLQQVVKNLISNAFKFTHAGSVTLEVNRCPGDVKLLRNNFDATNALAISVKDTGIGIPADKQEAVFEAFQQADGTTSRLYGGTGLGLSISREFAKFLGGELQLVSEVGKGSIFTIYLPVIYPESNSSVAEERSRSKVQQFKPLVAFPEKLLQSTETVGSRQLSNLQVADEQIVDDRKTIVVGDKLLLIIEDDINFAKILVEQARNKGFKCLVAEDGETGLHFADYYRPSAIILDIGLPGIDGWEVMDRLKENPDTRHIPVHFMSATDRSSDAIKMGAIGYLVKPISLEKLNEAFKNIENKVVETLKRLLIVEDDELQRRTLVELIGNGDVETTAVGEGSVALTLLRTEQFDCVILDLGLKDISGFDLLEKIKNDNRIARIPIIVYTGRDLTRQEEDKLKRYTDSIIVKGVRSAERLLDEANLFLHRVEANLPEDKQRKIRMSFDKEAVLKDKKILLVDDDMRNIFAIGSVLESKGMKMVVARNGRESLARLDEEPKMDLVLMDIMMPEMDGYEAMRQIRAQERFATLPVIALTAKAMKGDRNKCIEAGASDYLAKPVDIDKLLSLLRVWLYQQNKYMPDTIDD